MSSYALRHSCTVLPTIFLLFSPNGLAQTNDFHPDGLFKTPQEGMSVSQPRTPVGATSLVDMFHISLDAGVKYDNNIYLTDDNEESDVIFSISPILSFATAEPGTAASIFSFNYTPTARFYVDNSERDTVDHSLRLKFDQRLAKTQIGFELGYDKTSGSDRFVSGTIDRDAFHSAVSVSHILSGKTRLDFGAFYDIDDFDNSDLFDRKSYGGDIAVLYQATGKIALGPYFGYGRTTLNSGNVDQEYYEFGLRSEYEVSGKTAVSASIGGNVRSFDGSDGSGDESFFAWEAGISHELTAKTNLRASVYRNAKASYNFANSGYIATGLAVTASYAYSDRLSYYGTLSYEHNDYFRAASNGVNFDNNYYALRIGSRYRATDQLIVSAEAEYRENDSNSNANSQLNDFDNFLFSLNATYHFW